jgi:hypothetical protein
MSTTRLSRSSFPGALAAGSIVIFFCLILLWHDPLVFWNDDYELSILPVFTDVARSWGEGQFPLLSPYSWVCGNLAGEFQYGTFSIFVNAAVVLLWKLPLTFPQQAAALSMTHLFVLAMGGFVLARNRKLSIALSIFVALIAALNGWIICWGATDWFGALGAFAWLPWAWWGMERALDQTRNRWRFVWPAPFVYLLVTGGFPYTVLMLLVLIAWLSIKSLVETRSFAAILPMLLGVALGFGLSAPAGLAILDYVQGSARELQPSSAHWQWIVPWRALPGFILPCWTVNWADFGTRYLPHTATELACGLVAPAALVAGFLWRPRLIVRQLKWEFLLLLIALLLAMLPTAGLFRWSFRWLPFVHLVLAICAAEVLQLRPGLRTASAAMLILIVIVSAMSILQTTGPSTLSVTWVYLMVATLWIISEFSFRDVAFRQWATATATFGFLLGTYLCIPPNCGVPKYNLDQRLLDPTPLDPARLYLSIYPPPETDYRVEKKPEPIGQIVRPGSTSMFARLRFINGYSPIRPAGVARAFSAYIHGEIDPDMANYLVEKQSGPDGQLAQIGMDGIVIAQELTVHPEPASEWQPVFSNEEGRVFYRRGPPISAVRSQASGGFVVATVSNIDEKRNRVEADVNVPPGDRPALVVFSRPWFRGYRAWINGRALGVESAGGLIPAVKVPAGTAGRIKLEYRPTWLWFGTAVALVSMVILLIGILLGARRQTAS